MANRYFRGDTLTAQTTFTIDGDIADPLVVTAAAYDPDGNKTTISPTKIETGIWQASFTTSTSSTAGVWRLRISGVTDTETDTEEIAFLVEP